MKKALMLKMVRQEVRRALKPTGLLGKRGPAKNVPVMVQRAVDSIPRCACPGQGIGGSL